MKLITKNTCYAIKALCILSKSKDKASSVKRLSVKAKVPQPYLRSILQNLAKKGLVVSKKGKLGGFKLVKDLRKIDIISIMKIFQGPFKINECVIKGEICPDFDRCRLRLKLENISKDLFNKLSDLKLSDLHVIEKLG
jgi:Rrf2 family protein